MDDRGYRLFAGEDGRFSVAVPGGLLYSFGGDGRLERIETWNGTSVTVVRDPRTGSPVRVEHSCGKALTFELDGSGRIVRAQSPDPEVWAGYSYVTMTNRTQGQSFGSFPQYEVNGYGQYEECMSGNTVLLVRAERHDGVLTSAATYEYDGFKRYVRQPPASGDGGARLVAAKSGGGASGGTASAPKPQRLAFVKEFALSRKTDSDGISTDYEYFGLGGQSDRRCRRVSMSGGIMEMLFSYGGGTTCVGRETAFGEVTETVRFDDLKRETMRTLGDETRTKAYDSRGDAVLDVATNAATAHFLASASVYDDVHRLAGESSAYDSEPTLFTSVAWDDIDGEPSRFVSCAGRVSERVRGDRLYTIYGAGSNDVRLVSSVVCDLAWHPVLVTGPDGSETRFSYGAGGMVSRVERDALPSVRFGHDAMGHVSSIALPGPGATTRTTTLTNNWRGRPISVVHPDGTAESFGYDGNGSKIVRHVDRLGRVDTYRWVLGLPVHAGRVVDGTTNTLFRVAHDKQLNVVAITDPLGREAESYILDGNDRVAVVTNLEGQAMTREYALGKMVASETRFDGTTVAYGYDTDANLSSVVYPDETLSFGYDADGLLTSASNSVGVVTNLYDAATGWLDASQGADGTLVEYARSDGGAVTSMTSVAGTTAYSLDAAGRRRHLVTPFVAFDFGYCGWNGRLAAVTNSSGFVVQYAYDIMDRVTNISWRTTSGATLGGFSYEYDALGRIVSRDHALGTNAFDRVYNYDDFDRLASDGDVAYAYDAAGNRMTRTENGETITYTLGAGDRLASYGRAASTMPPQSGSYFYDAAGNVTRIERDGRPTLDLTWNSQYQLVSVSTNGVFAESYSYDALSRRVSTTTLEGTTRHVYDNNWQVIADIDENGSVVASYVWGDGIDKLLAVTIGGATYYPLTDIQGTVWGYVDPQNNVVARWQYDAWGNVLSEYVAPYAVALSKLRYRFQGHEWSAATGLINFRMRWYDADTGRWISKDPIGLSGGLNLYAFCKNTPLLYADAFGLCEDDTNWLDKFWDNYNDIDSEWSDFFFLDTSDSFSYIGVVSALSAMGTSALGSIAAAAAEAQINAGKLAGALCKGNIIQKIAAASEGAKAASRAAAGKMGLGLVSKASGVVGAGATVWSITVRGGFAIAAAAATVFGK